MGWFDSLVEKIKALIEWLGRDETQEVIKEVVEVATKVIGVIALFNDEPSNERKREYAWTVMKFLKYSDAETLEKMMELKKTGALDTMEAYEIDAIMGTSVAAFIKKKKVQASPEKDDGYIDWSDS